MTSPQAVIDKELAQCGWGESIATNSISDFKSLKVTLLKKTSDKRSD